MPVKIAKVDAGKLDRFTSPSSVLADYLDALLVARAEQPAAVVVVHWRVAPALMSVLMRLG
jgi:hypothetical protein